MQVSSSWSVNRFPETGSQLRVSRKKKVVEPVFGTHLSPKVSLAKT